MGHLPAGLMVSILTGIGATYAQTAFLQLDFVRRTLGIPLVDNKNGMKLPTLMESRRAFYKFMEDSKREAEKAARERNQ